MPDVTRLDVLRDLLDTWWRTAVHSGQRRDLDGLSQPRLSGAVTEQDARSFLSGLRTDPPLHVVENGWIRSRLLPGGMTRPPNTCHFFEKWPTCAAIREEWIAHYGAAADLVFKYGWDPDQIESEPQGRSGLSDGSLDLLVCTSDEVRLAVEAKAKSTLLRSLIRGMNACSGQGDVVGHGKSDHKKCEGLLEFRPKLFWGVACGSVRQLYRVEYLASSVRLHDVGDDGPLFAT